MSVRGRGLRAVTSWFCSSTCPGRPNSRSVSTPSCSCRSWSATTRGCREAIFANGGVIEKYIGDAIMAVFGILLSREDDALRAVLAAHGAMKSVYELADELERTVGVRIGAHVGVAFGEVMVVGNTGTDVRVIGDTVNTAARIQSAAKERDPRWVTTWPGWCAAARSWRRSRRSP